MTVGMAFQYFAIQNIDIAVVEVGVGGRLDSTNIVMPEVSVITNIGLDHTQFLGNTLGRIAFEKGGIIKPNIPVVVGETQIETASVFNDLAKKNHSEIVFADKTVNEDYASDLMGAYQSKNIKTVVQTITTLQNIDYKITGQHLKIGLLNVVKNTGLLGRWQILSTNPKVVCDTAHNREGLTCVMQQLAKESFKTLHIVFGVVNDKDLNTIVDLLPKSAKYYFCKPNISRALDANELQQKFSEHNLIGKAYVSVSEAYKTALNNTEKDDFVFVGGSTFVVSEII
jgi:dihydrofolate synthase/folylpolyglutamate synthase